MVVITSSERVPILGQEYALTCNVTGVNNLSNRTMIYQWTKNNGTRTQFQVETNSNALRFSALQLSDAGQYNCHIVVSSDSLVNNISVMTSFDIRITSKLSAKKFVCITVIVLLFISIILFSNHQSQPQLL